MILRKLLALLLIAALEAAPVVQAASITITDPACSDFAVSGTPGDLHLGCIASAPGNPPPPPPPPVVDLCAPFGVLREDTVPGTGVANMVSVGPFGGNVLYVVKVTTPKTWTPKPNRDGTPGTARDVTVSASEYMAGTNTYVLSASKTACDFRPVDPTGATGPVAMSSPDVGPNIRVPAAWFYPGSVYFINVRCLTGLNCGVIVQNSKP